MALGGAFAFHVTRAFAGFRWALVAAVTTLAIFTLGPAWYLFGRGLSELSSMGLLYAAALLALRGRHGYTPAIGAAALCAALAFFTRLNNLPMAVAVAAFAFPVALPVGEWFRPRAWARASRPVLAGILLGIAAALWFFTWRTWDYTGHIDLFYGTQASHLSIYKEAHSVMEGAQLLAGSLLMVLTMSDPPHFDPRAVPVVFGVVAAVAGVLGVPRFRQLPLNCVAICLAGMVGAFVARGTAYPGRFSVHLIPVAVTLTACTVSLFVTPARRPRSTLPVPQPPGTT